MGGEGAETGQIHPPPPRSGGLPHHHHQPRGNRLYSIAIGFPGQSFSFIVRCTELVVSLGLSNMRRERINGHSHDSLQKRGVV
jgi:hypothetical protein